MPQETQDYLLKNASSTLLRNRVFETTTFPFAPNILYFMKELFTLLFQIPLFLPQVVCTLNSSQLMLHKTAYQFFNWWDDLQIK